MGVNNNRSVDGFVHRNAWPYPWWFFSEGRFNPGGPAWYATEERLPAKMYMESQTILILSITFVLLLMFLVVLPVIRYRLYSSITALNTLAIGFTITMCMIVPEWIRGSVDIESTLGHYEPTVYGMTVGVHIGLCSSNVTLHYRYKVPDNINSSSWISHVSTSHFWYNEKVSTNAPEALEHFMPKILNRGMPTPMITVFQFLTASVEGFEWPHHLGEAGFHCMLILLFALLGWFLACLLIAAIPRYSSYAFIGVGFLMVSTTMAYFYWAMIDLVFPCIVVEDQFMQLRYGPCFWACLGVGVWSIMYGFSLAVFDLSHPDKFLTIFDFDYDFKRALARAHRLNQYCPTTDEVYRD